MKKHILGVDETEMMMSFYTFVCLSRRISKSTRRRRRRIIDTTFPSHDNKFIQHLSWWVKEDEVIGAVWGMDWNVYQRKSMCHAYSFNKWHRIYLMSTEFIFLSYFDFPLDVNKHRHRHSTHVLFCSSFSLKFPVLFAYTTNRVDGGDDERNTFF